MSPSGSFHIFTSMSSWSALNIPMQIFFFFSSNSFLFLDYPGEGCRTNRVGDFFSRCGRNSHQTSQPYECMIFRIWSLKVMDGDHAGRFLEGISSPKVCIYYTNFTALKSSAVGRARLRDVPRLGQGSCVRASDHAHINCFHGSIFVIFLRLR